METAITAQSGKRIKLIFNPGAGANSESPVQLMDIIRELQAYQLTPEPFLIKPDADLSKEINDAMEQGIQTFVVCGGDGTVSSVARELMGKNSVLGIIPTGTQNNIAFSLDIPKDIPEAAALLCTGRPAKVDMGVVSCEERATPFLEVCSIGLFSTIFPSADQIQHGNLLKIGDLLSALIGSSPAQIHLTLDDGREIEKTGHMLIVSNMPHVIRRYEVGAKGCQCDGLLDILLFADLTKLDLAGYVFRGIDKENGEDSPILRYHARIIDIDTRPAMPVMADGNALGEGRVHIEVRRHALTVITQSREKYKSKQGGAPDEKRAEQ